MSWSPKPDPDVKLCKDCVYYVSDWWDGCKHAKCAKYPSLVDGAATDYCDIERRNYGHRGPNGKNWVRKG